MSKMFGGGVGLVKANENYTKGSGKKQIYHEALELIEVVAGEGNTGYLVGKPYLSPYNSNDEVVRIKVKQADFDRNENKSNKVANALFRGHKIDGLMKAAFDKKPKNAKNIVLLEDIERKTTIKENGETIKVFECSYIHNITDSNKDKFKRTLITGLGYFDTEMEMYRIMNLQDWELKSVSLDDPEKLNIVKEMIDMGKEAEESGSHKLPPVGFQFRVIVKNPNWNKEDKKSKPFDVIGVSPCFDYIKEIGAYADGDFFMDKVEEFKVWVKEDTNIGSDYPEYFLEVIYYKNLPSTQHNKQFVLKTTQTGSPLYQMITTRTGLFYDAEINGDNALRGRNWGGFAYVALSSDKDEVLKDEDGNATVLTKYRNYVNKLFMSGYRGNIQSFITAHFDCPEGEDDNVVNGCSIHKSLYRITDTNTNVVNDVSSDEIEKHQNSSSEHDMPEDDEHEIDAKTVTAKAVVVDVVDDDIPF